MCGDADAIYIQYLISITTRLTAATHCSDKKETHRAPIAPLSAVSNGTMAAVIPALLAFLLACFFCTETGYTEDRGSPAALIP